MLVWINGAFGAGNTRRDCQDPPQWRAAVIAALLDAEAANDGPVIAPMTLADVAYFDEIVGNARCVEALASDRFATHIATDWRWSMTSWRRSPDWLGSS